MSKIRIISISNSKKNPYLEKSLEYKKWISKFINIELIDIEDKKSKDKIGKMLFNINCFKKYLVDNNKSILLDVSGKSLDTEEFSNSMINNALGSSINLDFFIAGAYGLSEADKKLFDMRLSVSSFTLPHDLAKLVLLEQIYRSCTIINNIKYNY